jgi:hypothetical protein
MLRMSTLALAFLLLAWSSKADSVDTCVYLDNFDLTSALNSELSISSIPDSYGRISQCLCVSGINGTLVIIGVPGIISQLACQSLSIKTLLQR